MLKLNVGFNRKTGEPNYGSRGASVHLELELDSSLVGDAERLKDRIRQLFLMAKASVDEELALAAAGGSMPSPSEPAAGGRRPRDNTRRATAPQIRALVAIAERRQLDLADLITERFGTPDPAALSIVEASGLIDELKQAASGVGGGG